MTGHQSRYSRLLNDTLDLVKDHFHTYLRVKLNILPDPAIAAAEPLFPTVAAAFCFSIVQSNV